MVARTNDAEVKGLLTQDYDTENSPSLTPFIDTAHILTDWVVTCAGAGYHTSTELRLIEAWLAAHFYKSAADLALSEEKIGKSEGKAQGKTGFILTSTFYGQQALLIDHSGCLTKRSKGAEEGKKTASSSWLGLDVDEQESPNY